MIGARQIAAPRMTQNQIIEEAGFEALQRLYEFSLRPTGQSRNVASFLLGLYNGQRFPFDLTDLRGLNGDMFEDCMAVLRMDGLPTTREVQSYFDNGRGKFEDLAERWAMVDMLACRVVASRAG